jgi:hypothetical protein
MMDTLLEVLKEARTWLDTAAQELEADPRLENDDDWREHLGQTGYRISDLLDEDAE